MSHPGHAEFFVEGHSLEATLIKGLCLPSPVNTVMCLQRIPGEMEKCPFCLLYSFLSHSLVDNPESPEERLSRSARRPAQTPQRTACGSLQLCRYSCDHVTSPHIDKGHQA